MQSSLLVEKRSESQDTGRREVFPGAGITFYECDTPETNRIHGARSLVLHISYPVAFDARYLPAYPRRFLRLKMRIDVICVPRRQWIQKHGIFRASFNISRGASNLERPTVPGGEEYEFKTAVTLLSFDDVPDRYVLSKFDEIRTHI